jgi:hypothetical protein
MAEFRLLALQGFEMLPQHGHRLVTRQDIGIAADHVEHLPDLGNRHAKLAQQQDVLQAPHIAGQIGAKPSMPRWREKFRPLVKTDCLRVGGRQLRQFTDE